MDDELGELDAVITGCALEYAVATLDILQQGKRARARFSPEMLCTLDNFIKVVLFSDRTFVTGVTSLRENQFIPREVHFEEAKTPARLARLGVVLEHREGAGDSKIVFPRIEKILGDASKEGHFYIRCELPDERSAFLQEYVVHDPYFIEYAIEQFGAFRFKAVFPGEHAYLALRAACVPIERRSHTIADLVGARPRQIVSRELQKLNRFTNFGAPYIAPLPPIYVSMLIRAAGGGNLYKALANLRANNDFSRLRRWIKRTTELGRGPDLRKRQAAAAALQQLEAYEFAQATSGAVFRQIKLALQVLRGDYVGALLAQAEEVAKSLASLPLAGLGQFSGAANSQDKLKRYLRRVFGDEFRRNELNAISLMLGLSDSLHEWKARKYSAQAIAQRLTDDPPLSRPYYVETEDHDLVQSAKDDFADIWERAEPVTPEMIAKWEAEERASVRPKRDR